MYPVELVVVPHTRHLPQAELPATVQVTCKAPNEPARKCADDWNIDRDASHKQKTFNLELPGGWNEISFQHEGTPIKRAYIGIPGGYPGRRPNSWHSVFTRIDGKFVDAYSDNISKTEILKRSRPRASLATGQMAPRISKCSPVAVPSNQPTHLPAGSQEPMSEHQATVPKYLATLNCPSYQTASSPES